MNEFLKSKSDQRHQQIAILRAVGLLVLLCLLAFSSLGAHYEWACIELNYLYGEDFDKDGLSLLLESELHTDPCDPDTDDDGLLDGHEVKPHIVPVTGNEIISDPYSGRITGDEITTDPLVADTDGDGLTDGQEEKGVVITIDGVERTVLSNPREPDTDGDGIRDGTEFYTHGTDPGKADSDDDGLDDPDELEGYTIIIVGQPFFIQTSPTLSDTDGDGLNDGDEVNGFVVRIPGGSNRFVRTNGEEPDTDGDGIWDGIEIKGFSIVVGDDRRFVKTDPTDPDTDGDTISDSAEISGYRWKDKLITTDPTRKDSDDDRLDDNLEMDYGTNASDPDSDGDEIKDGWEVFVYRTLLASSWTLGSCSWKLFVVFSSLEAFS